MSFFTTFIIVAILILTAVGSKELFAYVIYTLLIYIVVGSIGWLLINYIVKPISIYQIVIRFFGGLFILNLFSYFLFDKVPILTLVGLAKKHDNFWFSFSIHVLFLISFVVASFPDIRAFLKKEHEYTRQQ